MLFLEIGNTTFKLARPLPNGTFRAERFTDSSSLLEKIPSSEALLLAPVAQGRASQIFPLLQQHAASLTVLSNQDFAWFIGDSYDTPNTLGLDRILNLYALQENRVVVSCGTAITVDVLVDGVPRWGAILSGFQTAIDGLTHQAPALPNVSADGLQGLPARTSHGSVANGIFLGTALSVYHLAMMLVQSVGLPPETPLVLTGGDAALLSFLWENELEKNISNVTQNPDLLFVGMQKSLQR